MTPIPHPDSTGLTGAAQRGGLWRLSCARDADEQAMNLSSWDQRYDQLSAGVFEGTVRELWLPKTQIFVERANQQLRQSCAAWKESVWFGIPAVGEGQMRMGQKALSADAVCVRDGGREFELMTAADFDLFGIVMDRSELSAYLETTLRLELDQLLQRDVIILPSARKLRLCAELNNILTDADVASAEPGVLQARILEVLSEILMEGQAAPAGNLRPARQLSAARVREHILARPEAPPSIPELCEALHVSRRTLQNWMEEVTGLSPLHFIRSVRLNEVRRRVKHGRGPVSVSGVAYEWGFNHLSQFAKDYRQQFGELPSESIPRAL